jgi:small subunit ribosomal protein S4
MRLDNIVFRLGIGMTIRAARQEVLHRHVFLKGKCVTFPSYQCKVGDLISVDSCLSLRCEAFVWERPHYGIGPLPRFLGLVSRRETGEATHVNTAPVRDIGRVLRDPNPRDIPFELNVLLVIEYYSRKI